MDSWIAGDGSTAERSIADEDHLSILSVVRRDRKKEDTLVDTKDMDALMRLQVHLDETWLNPPGDVKPCLENLKRLGYPIVD